jgi:hypothetical protein
VERGRVIGLLTKSCSDTGNHPNQRNLEQGESFAPAWAEGGVYKCRIHARLGGRRPLHSLVQGFYKTPLRSHSPAVRSSLNPVVQNAYLSLTLRRSPPRRPTNRCPPGTSRNPNHRRTTPSRNRNNRRSRHRNLRPSTPSSHNSRPRD